MLCRLSRTRRVPRSQHGRISLRAVLLLVLGLGIAVLCLDVRARTLSKDADVRLAEVSSDENSSPSEIQRTMQRKPTSTREVSGGVIELYHYMGGVPWRSYDVRVGYAEGAEKQLQFLDHNFNQEEGELHLEYVIAAHQYRLLNPPPEEGEDLQGPVEVAVNDVYTGVQRGGRLVLAYDSEAHTFSGAIRNTTRETIKRVRVAVLLSNGTQVGPITLGHLEPGSEFSVELKTESTEFDRWTAYVENDLYLNEKYDAVRYGARVVLAYDSDTKTFTGTVRNTTTEPIDGIQVDVRLANGTKLGPAMLDAIPPDSELDVELKTEREDFNGWSVHTVMK